MFGLGCVHLLVKNGGFEVLHLMILNKLASQSSLTVEKTADTFVIAEAVCPPICCYSANIKRFLLQVAVLGVR